MNGRILFGGFSLGFVTTWSLNTILLSPAFAQPGEYRNWHMGQGMMGNWGMDTLKERYAKARKRRKGKVFTGNDMHQ